MSVEKVIGSYQLYKKLICSHSAVPHKHQCFVSSFSLFFKRVINRGRVEEGNTDEVGGE